MTQPDCIEHIDQVEKNAMNRQSSKFFSTGIAPGISNASRYRTLESGRLVVK